MQITIENFGPIKHFVFDTEKNLTLIFGKNSVGKSYGISLVYLILKIIHTMEDSILDSLKFMKDVTKIAINSEVNTETSFDKLASYMYTHIVATPLNKSISDTFGDLKNISNQFSKEEFKITIENKYMEAVLGLNSIENGVILKKFEMKNRFKSFLEVLVSEPLKFDIYYLPASRSGLYQGSNSLGEIFAELSQKRSFISKKVSIPSYSEPISDYLLTLFSIERTDINPDFAEYINEIEQEILQGKIEFNPQTKKISFIPNNTTLRLDVALASSSMVAEIAPIVSYLKHVLSITCVKDKKQTILFIEEPEAHLHPETQVKLMRVFARLVKDNKIKLVMTSHSNYIFNAASNLIMDNKIPADKFEAVLFKMTEEGSVAQNMATDEYGIDDDNFIDVAESLYEEKIEIINKLNG